MKFLLNFLIVVLFFSLLSCSEDQNISYYETAVHQTDYQSEDSFLNLGLEKELSESQFLKLNNYKEAYAELQRRNKRESKASIFYQNETYQNGRFFYGKIEWKDYASYQPDNEKEAAALFLSSYKSYFGIQNPEAELKLKEINRDALGYFHLKYDQYYQSYPVFGAQLIVHLDENLSVTAANGQFIPDIKLSDSGYITKDEAIHYLEESFSKENPNQKDNLIIHEIKMIVFDRAIVDTEVESYKRMAWQVTTEFEEVFLDAGSGEIVLRFDRYHGARNIATYDMDGLALNQDRIVPSDRICIREPCDQGECPNGEIMQTDLLPGGCSRDLENIHRYVQDSYDYFLDTFGRQGYDNYNAGITILANYPTDSAKAQSNTLFFPPNYGSNPDHPQLEGTKDIVGHEYTHLIIKKTAGLIYFGQSGAVNESLADFFGVMVDRDQEKWWEILENIPGRDINNRRDRSMKQPRLGLFFNNFPPYHYDDNTDQTECYDDSGQPDHMNRYCICPEIDGKIRDNGCVHTNSGILNRAAYLIIDNLGGINDPDKRAEKIYYRAMTQFLTRSDNFSSSKESIFAACLDLVAEVPTIDNPTCNFINEAFEDVGIDSGNQIILGNQIINIKPNIEPTRSILSYDGEQPAFEINLPRGYPFYIIELASDPRLFISDQNPGNRILLYRDDTNFVSTFDIHGRFLNIFEDGDTYQLSGLVWNLFRKNLWKNWLNENLETVLGQLGESSLEPLLQGGRIYYRVIASPVNELNELNDDLIYSRSDIVRHADEVEPIYGNHTIPSAEVARWRPDGSLVKIESSNAVYYIEEARARWVCDEDSFNSHNFNFDNVVTISEAELKAYRGDDCPLDCINDNDDDCNSILNCPQDCPETYPERLGLTLYKEVGRPAIWVEDNANPQLNFLCYFANSETYKSWGFSIEDNNRDGVWDSVHHPHVRDVESFTGKIKNLNCPYPMRTGTIVADSSSPNEIYVIYDGKRRRILNDDIYQAMYDDPNYSRRVLLNPGVLEAITTDGQFDLSYTHVGGFFFGFINSSGFDDNVPNDPIPPQAELGDLPEIVFGNDQIEIEWNVSDNLGVVRTDLYFTSNEWHSQIQLNQENLTPHQNENQNGIYRWTVPLLNSNHASIRLVTEDLAGNTVSDTSHLFTIEARAPAPELYRVEGYIRDQAGQGVVGTHVNIRNLTIGENYGSRLTGADGYFQMGGLRAGLYRVQVSHPQYIIEDNERRFELNENQRLSRQDFLGILPTFSLRGQVQLGNGQALEGVPIRIESVDQVFNVETDENGFYEKILPANDYRVIPSHPDYSFSPIFESVYHDSLSRVNFRASAQGAEFLEVTEISGIEARADDAYSLGITDYNNDGWEDIYINYNLANAPNKLYRNNQDGSFSDVSIEARVHDRAVSRGQVWADFDGDGWLDLFVCNAEGFPNRLYRNDQNGRFNDLAVDFGLDLPDSDTWGASFGDYDGDGDLDLVLSRFAESSKIFENQNGEGFIDVSDNFPFLNVEGNRNSRVASWYDYDHDGDMDLLLGGLGFYENRGERQFVELPISITSTNGFAWADFNNNGDDDFFLSRSERDRHDNFFIFNHGEGNVYQDLSEVYFQASQSYSAAWVDYDNDAYLDLHKADGFFKNDRENAFQEQNEAIDLVPCYQSCLWFDYNKDGSMDLLSAHINSNLSVQLFQSRERARELLRVRLQGDAPNTFGIGARLVAVFPDGRRQYRQVHNSTGAGDSISPIQYFGLGEFDAIESLYVNWPSGRIDELHDLVAGEDIIILEGEHQDQSQPSTINTLAISHRDERVISLSWLAPSDDELYKVSSYEIRMNFFEITEDNWNQSILINQNKIPADPGQIEEFIVDGLRRNTVYYFAIRSRDEAGNLSSLSNNISGTLSYGDRIYDLRVERVSQRSVDLRWTAVDVPQGQYQLALSNNPITPLNWDQAQIINLEQNIGIRGDLETYSLENLEPLTNYYLALRINQNNELGPLSNLIQFSTLVEAINVTSPQSQTVPLPDADFSLKNSIRQAGDLDNDGFDDFLVFSRVPEIGGGNYLSLIYGAPDFNSRQPLNFSEADLGYALNFLAAGDLNNDEIDDLMVGADPNGSPGKVYFYWGDDRLLDAEFDADQTGVDPLVRFSHIMNALPDRNGDGDNDYFIGDDILAQGTVFLGGESFQEVYQNISWIRRGRYLNSFIADFDGDDEIDFVISHDDAVSVFYGENSLWPQNPNQETRFLNNLISDLTVADLNNDDRDDLILLHSSSSSATIYWGSPEGLNLDQADETIETIGNIDDQENLAVIDMNRDGIDDLLISAKTFDNRDGKVDVFLGQAEFRPIADFSLNPVGLQNEFGSQVANVGDTNGDGFDDLVISDRERLFFYESDPSLRFRDDIESPGAINDLEAVFESMGEVTLTWVARGDDLDEGRASFFDLRYLIGDWPVESWSFATQVRDEPNPREPMYVHSYTFDENDLVAGMDYSFRIRAGDDWLNWSLDSNLTTGRLLQPFVIEDIFHFNNTLNANFSPKEVIANFDFNNDGQKDIFFSNNFDSSQRNNAGALYYYSSTQNLRLEADQILRGPLENSKLGALLSHGDVNGNGFDDLLVVSGEMQDLIQIYYGGNNADFAPDRTFQAPGLISNIVTGNLDGDDYDDLIICQTERFLIYWGGPQNGPNFDLEINWPEDHQLTLLTNHRPSTRVSDINGDGFEDLIMAIGEESDGLPGQYNGRVWIFFGSEDNFNNQTDLIINPPVDEEERAFAKSLGTADLNSDGIRDLIVSSYHDQTSQKIFVYFGGEDFDETPDAVIHGPDYQFSHNALLAHHINSIGDINGDGFEDVAFTFRHTDRHNWVGVVLGGEELSSEISYVIPGLSSEFGTQIQALGDIDQDGFDEFYIGQNIEGWVYGFNDISENLPLADAGFDFDVLIGQEVQLQALSENVDSYLWRQTAGIKVELNDNQIANPQFIAPHQEGELRFQLLVRSDSYLSYADEVVVYVNLDTDGDGIVDRVDNCPQISNENQIDTDHDGLGNDCDEDDDGDGIPDENDLCPLDEIHDEVGDPCVRDEDGDGLSDNLDPCPFDNNHDFVGNPCVHDEDEDGFLDENDNCYLVANLDQADFDNDNQGDLCDDDIDGDDLPNDFDYCEYSDLDQAINNYGCNDSQNLCESIVDLRDHLYEEEACYLLNEGHWSLVLGDFEFLPDEDFTVLDEIEVLLSVGGLIEEASAFNGGLCPIEPLLSYAVEEQILSSDDCILLDSRRRLSVLLLEIKNLYFKNRDNLDDWDESLIQYEGPHLEDLAEPYGIEAELFQVAHQRQALVDFGNGFDINNNDYGRRIVTRGEAAYMIYWMLGLSDDNDRDGLIDENDPCPWRFSPDGNCEAIENPGFFENIFLLREIIRAFNELIDVSNPDILAAQFPNYRFEDFDLTSDGIFNINDVDLAIAAFLNDPYDHDGDGVLGYYELRCQYVDGVGLVLDPRNPQTYVGQNDGDLDCDGDGISNLQELEEGRDPLDAMN